MAPPLYCLNGPNLNLLGTREPHVYGKVTFAQLERQCINFCMSHGYTLVWLQSNHEGQLIDWIHQAREDSAGVLINAGALSHTSLGLYDALCAYPKPVVEVHISNVYAREAFRAHSYISPRANGIIVGCGTNGYILGLQQLVYLAQQDNPPRLD